MNIKEFFIVTANDDNYNVRPRITMADGFSMSVQAGPHHYSSPRQHLSDGDFVAFEIGFPSAKEPLLMEYAEAPETPTETVYGYVPANIVNEIIDLHGGIDIIKTFSKS